MTDIINTLRPEHYATRLSTAAVVIAAMVQIGRPIPVEELDAAADCIMNLRRKQQTHDLSQIVEKLQAFVGNHYRTQTEAAKDLGVSRAYLSAVLRGKIRRPKGVILAVINLEQKVSDTGGLTHA